MSEYDQRQYRLMLDWLVAFEEGKLPLDKLVDDLEALMNVLEEAPPGWKNSFLSDWITLEEMRASALFKGLRTFDDRSTQIIRAATAQMKLMVLEQITIRRITLKRSIGQKISASDLLASR